jgi:flagellar L-ring protein FlgH
VSRTKLVMMLIIPVLCAGGRKKGPQETDIEKYVSEATGRSEYLGRQNTTLGSTYSPGGRLGELFRDQRAYQIDDLVTILVSDQASAVSSGGSTSSRKSSTKNGVTSLAGVLPAAGPLANLAGLNGETKLDGQGQTSRSSQLSTTLSARVTYVLPNGNLVLEGVKQIAVNSERQTVIVRGVCRPEDLSQGNVILSEKLAFLEVHIHGRGVVGDAVRRPFILYRILLGLLPL